MVTGLITKIEFGSIHASMNPAFPEKGSAKYVDLQIWAEDVPDGDARAVKYGYSLIAGMAMDPQEETGYIFKTYEDAKAAGCEAVKAWLAK